MRIVTWNVNSLRARLDYVTQWLGLHRPDICCLQETKLDDKDFPFDAFAQLGYEAVHHGSGRWNGVAILSRLGIESARSCFHDEPEGTDPECRVVAADCGGVHVLSVYVPNGRVVDSEHYEAKLAWLQQLRAELEATCRPEQSIVVCGDFNVAPEDRDVWDITQFAGATHVTEKERDGFRALLAWGLTDTVRKCHPDEVGPFSWWDYRAGSFHKGWGMRIDHVLASAPLAARLSGAFVDREARKKGGSDGAQTPSDHAPVVVDFDGSAGG